MDIFVQTKRLFRVTGISCSDQKIYLFLDREEKLLKPKEEYLFNIKGIFVTQRDICSD